MNTIKTIVGDSIAGTREIITETRGIFNLLPDPIRRPDPNNEIVNNALQSSSTVHVFQHRRFGLSFGRLLFWGFEPISTSSAKKKGIILYPGTLVDVKAYAPLAYRLAENGYYAALVTPPLSLSVADADLANDVINFKGWKHLDNDSSTSSSSSTSNISWVVAGHSQGGAFASIYASKNRNIPNLKGVVLLAAYASSNYSLRDRGDDYKVISIYGTNDGIALYEDVVVEGANLLPSDTKFVDIEGGNHTQFSYVAELQVSGEKVDGVATISVDEQQDIICREILSLLSEIE